MEYLSPLGLSILQSVVELGSFRAAADKLKISQPAVSAHIHRIEEYLETELFERPYRKNLRLTEAGQLIYDYAVEVSAKNREVLTLLKDINDGYIGQVKFASSICATLFSGIIASYTKSHPEVSITYRTGNSIEVRKLVHQGRVDFGITQKVARSSNFTYKSLYREPMILFCSETHALANTKKIKIEDVHNHHLITCLDGSDYNNTVCNYLYSLGMRRHNCIQVEEGGLILKIVQLGEGLGILPRSSVQYALDQGRIVELELEGIQLPYLECQLIFRKKTLLSRSAERFLKFVKNEVDKNKYVDTEMKETTKKIPIY